MLQSMKLLRLRYFDFLSDFNFTFHYGTWIMKQNPLQCFCPENPGMGSYGLLPSGDHRNGLTIKVISMSNEKQTGGNRLVTQGGREVRCGKR